MNNLREILKKRIIQELYNDLGISKIIKEGENGHYPPGTEFDPLAPWNEKNKPEISNYSLNDNEQKFNVLFSNGKSFAISYIDVLEKYWKNHPGSFQKHDTEFGHLEDESNVAIVRKLQSENFDFNNYLYEIAESSEKFYDDF